MRRRTVADLGRRLVGSRDGAPRRIDAEDGFIGGWEVLPFGLLLFVAGTLLLVNAWAVVEARLVVGDAAREGARAFVHADSEAEARRAADEAVTEAITARGRDAARVVIDPVVLDPGFVRCATVTVHVHTTVPAIVVPFIGGFGHGFTVEGTQQEIIDPFRAGLPSAAVCDG